MTASSIRLYALIAASAFALALPARAVDSPSPMADKPKAATAAPKATSKATNTKKKKPKKEDQKSEQQFIDGYKAAHAMIYKGHDYAAGIDKLKSLGHDVIRTPVFADDQYVRVPSITPLSSVYSRHLVLPHNDSTLAR